MLAVVSAMMSILLLAVGTEVLLAPRCLLVALAALYSPRLTVSLHAVVALSSNH